MVNVLISEYNSKYVLENRERRTIRAQNRFRLYVRSGYLWYVNNGIVPSLECLYQWRHIQS